jgi:hypothetical protein
MMSIGKFASDDEVKNVMHMWLQSQAQTSRLGSEDF